MVLDVVLYNSVKRVIESEDKFKIQELELASFIKKILSTFETQAPADLKSFGELPRRCRNAAVENVAQTLKKVIAYSAEHRIQNKMLLFLKS